MSTIIDNPADSAGVYILDGLNPSKKRYKAVPFDVVKSRVESAVNGGDYTRLRHLLVRSSVEPPRFYPLSLLLDPSEALPYYGVEPLARVMDALESRE